MLLEIETKYKGHSTIGINFVKNNLKKEAIECASGTNKKVKNINFSIVDFSSHKIIKLSALLK